MIENLPKTFLHSGEWRIINGYIEDLIEDQRDRLEIKKDPIECATIRGRIKALRELRAAIQTIPAAPVEFKEFSKPSQY